MLGSNDEEVRILSADELVDIGGDDEFATTTQSKKAESGFKFSSVACSGVCELEAGSSPPSHSIRTVAAEGGLAR